MKLNLRLIGVLYGLLIVALAGRFLLELGGRSRGGAAAAAAALLQSCSPPVCCCGSSATSAFSSVD